MFRRRSDAAPAVLDNDAATTTPAPGRQVGKGKPTPKRSDTERKRRQPYAAPPTTKAGRKAAATQDRGHRRAEQQRRMAAMRRGEEWAMPARERGPARALARDYLDSRRLVLSEYVLFFILGLLVVMLITRAAASAALVLYVEIAVVALVFGESAYHASRVTRLGRQRLPGTNMRGMTWYIVKRAIKLRATRIPPPRVARGGTF